MLQKIRTAWRIFRLKSRARDIVLELVAMRESRPGGLSMIRYIKPQFAMLEKELAEIASELQLIDPNFPKHHKSVWKEEQESSNDENIR